MEENEIGSEIVFPKYEGLVFDIGFLFITEKTVSKMTESFHFQYSDSNLCMFSRSFSYSFRSAF